MVIVQLDSVVRCAFASPSLVLATVLRLSFNSSFCFIGRTTHAGATTRGTFVRHSCLRRLSNLLTDSDIYASFLFCSCRYQTYMMPTPGPTPAPTRHACDSSSTHLCDPTTTLCTSDLSGGDVVPIPGTNNGQFVVPLSCSSSLHH